MQFINYEENSNQVCLLNKTLYELKQSARQFYLFLANLLKELNFNSITADQFVFYNSDSNIIITAHINDLLVFAADKNDIKSLKQQIEKKLVLFDLNEISYYFDMKIQRDRAKRTLFLSQKKYINELLSKFNISSDKPIYSPDVQDVRLKKNTEQAEANDINLYQQQIDSLMYLMTATRPDIAFSVCNCARFMSNSNQKHFNALKRIWQYVKTTSNKGLLYESSDILTLKSYVDSD